MARVPLLTYPPAGERVGCRAVDDEAAGPGLKDAAGLVYDGAAINGVGGIVDGHGRRRGVLGLQLDGAGEGEFAIAANDGVFGTGPVIPNQRVGDAVRFCAAGGEGAAVHADPRAARQRPERVVIGDISGPAAHGEDAAGTAGQAAVVAGQDQGPRPGHVDKARRAG